MFLRTFTYFEHAWSMHFYTSSFPFSIFTLLVRRSAFCAFSVHRSRFGEESTSLGKPWRKQREKAPGRVPHTVLHWYGARAVWSLAPTEEEDDMAVWTSHGRVKIWSQPEQKPYMAVWIYTAVWDFQRPSRLWPCAPHGRVAFPESGRVLAVWSHTAVQLWQRGNWTWPCESHTAVSRGRVAPDSLLYLNPSSWIERGSLPLWEKARFGGFLPFLGGFLCDSKGDLEDSGFGARIGSEDKASS